jgi:transcriptional regulator with XRE-family HTH domain
MTQMIPEVEEEVRRYAALLKQAIRAGGLSVSEVERRLGAGPKALRRIFNGQVDLKVRHVIAILRILGLSQEQFFAIAARPRRAQVAHLPTHAPAQPSATDFLAAFHRVGYRGDMAPVDEIDPASPEEFDRLVEEAVNRVLARKRLEDRAQAEAKSQAPGGKGQVTGGGGRPDS